LALLACVLLVLTPALSSAQSMGRFSPFGINPFGPGMRVPFLGWNPFGWGYGPNMPGYGYPIDSYGDYSLPGFVGPPHPAYGSLSPALHSYTPPRTSSPRIEDIGPGTNTRPAATRGSKYSRIDEIDPGPSPAKPKK
jgi:hypothetical protein